jgi:hypothetical protein
MDYGTLELEMGRRSCGYGRWNAPYWFIGPEQGKGKDERDDNAQRVKAWQQLGRAELCELLGISCQNSRHELAPGQAESPTHLETIDPAPEGFSQ